MSKYAQFIFENYQFDRSSGNLELHYSLDGRVKFKELYKFNWQFTDYDDQVLDKALQLLFFMAGVSYYRTYLPPEIVIKTGAIDREGASFLNKTYQRGLGELFYINQLDPLTPINFPVNSSEIQAVNINSAQGMMIAIGGGKDSLVSVELLRNRVPDVITWSVGSPHLMRPIVERIGLPHFWIERQWDPLLLDLKNQDAYKGHIPISAIYACIGVVAAILAGKRDIVVSNESSANEPTLTYKGQAINHQYSKSMEFEQDFQALLAHKFGDGIRYYSFLRPFSELRIAELFSKNGFDKYQGVFSSCNRAFKRTHERLFWCGICPKCAFVFLALTPFVPREKLEKLWNGKNLLKDLVLEPTYRQLLGIEGNKPLECVGEIKENRAAMRLAQKIYPELKKYQFELPEDYDFRSLGPHSIPNDIYPILESAIS